MLWMKLATDFFLYLLKTSENFWFFDVFRGYWKRPKVWNGLICRILCWMCSNYIYIYIIVCFVRRGCIQNNDYYNQDSILKNHNLLRPLHWRVKFCIFVFFYKIRNDSNTLKGKSKITFYRSLFTARLR